MCLYRISLAQRPLPDQRPRGFSGNPSLADLTAIWNALLDEPVYRALTFAVVLLLVATAAQIVFLLVTTVWLRRAERQVDALERALSAATDEEALIVRSPRAVVRAALERQLTSAEPVDRDRALDHYRAMGFPEVARLEAQSVFDYRRERALRRLLLSADPSVEDVLREVDLEDPAARVLAAQVAARLDAGAVVLLLLGPVEISNELMEQPLHVLLDDLSGGQLELLLGSLELLVDPRMQKCVLMTAAEKVPAAVVPRLRHLADSPTMELRLAAAEAAGRIAGAESRELLVTAMSDPAWEVRGAALEWLSARHDVDSVQLAESSMSDEAFWVRVAAGHLLLEQGERGLSVLERLSLEDGPAGKMAGEALDAARWQA